MKKIAFMLCFFALIFYHSTAQAKFPVHLGGFALGGDTAAYQNSINMESCREIPFKTYLGEGRIIPPPGFKSGTITYGLCDKKNKILRIKLKFKDSSRPFFKKLLREYKEQLGQPDEYKGDPFHTLIAWKWSFTNNKKEKISLILQYNNVIGDEKMGNTVKLTLMSQLKKERACFKKNFPKKRRKPDKTRMDSKAMWKMFVPY